MAETKKIVFEFDIENQGKVISSIKDLKKELKAAESAALNGDGKASKRVAELKDALDDLKDSTKTLQGSGVEKVTNSFGLLGEGLRNFDFDKIKTGFKGIGTAMSAIPIFLIAEGVSYLIENWKELSEGNGVLAKTLQGVTWIFEKLVEEITAVTDALGLSNSALDKQGEAIQENATKSTEALSAQNAQYDRQIQVAKAAGKSTVELEKAKQQAIIDTNLAVARQIQAFVAAGGALDDEKKKILTASLEAIKNAKVQEYVIEQNDTKQKKEEYKKRAEDKKKATDDLFAQALAEQEKEEQFRTQTLEKQKKEEEALASFRKKQIEELNALQLKADQDEVASQVAAWDEEKRLADEAKALHEKNVQENFNTSLNAANALQGLADTVFNLRMAKVKKGSVEEEKLARKQFNINKALQLTLAGIDAAKAITTSLAAAPLVIGAAPNPAGIAGLASAIATSAAAITAIAAKQFQPSGGDTATPSPSIGGIGGGDSAPNTSAPRTTPTTGLDEQGRVINRDSGEQGAFRAYVVESEMTDKQKRVNRLQNQASFG